VPQPDGPAQRSRLERLQRRPQRRTHAVVWVCLLCFVRCTVASPCRSGHVRLDGPHKAQLRRRSPARIREAGEGRPTAVWYQQPLVVDSTVPYSARAPIVLRVRNGAAGRVGRCCMRTTAARGKARRNCTHLNHVPELRNACVRAECRDPMHTII
jgi:hypothetical protein